MTKNEQARLRKLVDECTEELISRGRHQTVEVYEMLMDRYEHEVMASAKEMVRGFVAERHRQYLRGSKAFSNKSMAQLELPNILQKIDIPGSITIPYRTDDGKDELLWTTFEEATFAEFEGYAAILRAQIAADTKRLSNVMAIHQEVTSHVEDENETMGSIFKRLFGRDRDAA